MRLCVRCLRVCAGEEKHILRKSAFWARTLTEKRILGAGPHGKAHSGLGPSRKGALCSTACRMRLLVRPTRKVRFSVTSPAQSAPFGHVAVASPAQNAPFRESDTPRVRLCVRRRLQSGAHVYAAATRFAEASTHTNPRRARFVYTFAPPWKPRPMGSQQARARSSCERALSFWRRTSQPQPPRDPPIGRAPPSCPPPVPMVLPSPGLLVAGPTPLGARP